MIVRHQRASGSKNGFRQLARYIRVRSTKPRATWFLAANLPGVTTSEDLEVEARFDVKKGLRTSRDEGEAPLELPESDLLVFELEGGHRVVLRPSDTEPKLDYYVDVRIEIAPEEKVEPARQRGNALIDTIIDAMRP